MASRRVWLCGWVAAGMLAGPPAFAATSGCHEGFLDGTLDQLGKWLGDLGSIFGGASAQAAPPEGASPQGRAQLSWDALNRAMQSGGHLTFAPGSARAGVWPYGQALQAALDLAKESGNYQAVDRLFAGLSGYREGIAYTPHFGASHAPRFYDDNAWIGLDLMQAYSQTHDPRYLRQAEALYRFEREGMAPGGGEHWRENPLRQEIDTCSTGPTAEMALLLYQATHDPSYLADAKRQVAFLEGKLRRPDGFYLNGIYSDGTPQTAIFTYNQGTPLGAEVLLYQITGKRAYLTRAQETAAASLAWFGGGDRLWKSSPIFNAIFFRNLMALDRVAPDPAYTAALDRYLQRAWTEGRDPATGLFDRGVIAHYGGAAKTQLLDQAAFVQMFALAAGAKR